MKIKSMETIRGKDSVQLYALTENGQIFFRDIQTSIKNKDLIMSDWIDVTQDLPSE